MGESVIVNYNEKKVKIKLPEGTGNVVRTIRKGRFYEQKFLDYIRSLGLKGTYVDVGANIGNHSLFFGLFTNAERVVSIEASKDIFKILNENIKLNGLQDKIKTHNIAAGAEKGKVSLRLNEADLVGGGQIIPGQDIIMDKVDKIVGSDVRVVKIDVEGFELEVIKGMTRILAEDTPELFIEASKRDELVAITKELRKYNYKKITTYNNTATHHFSAKMRKTTKGFLMGIYPVRRAVRSS